MAEGGEGGGGAINPVSLPPGDPRLILLIVEQLKRRGLFASLDRDCEDTQPAYQTRSPTVDALSMVDAAAQTTSESCGDQEPECAPVRRAQHSVSACGTQTEPHFPAASDSAANS